MTDTSHAALILGGSGRTGSLVARHLAGHGIPARTASRHGSEAFVDAADIAAVAAEPLLNPGAHAGAHYALTGPQALTFGDVAAVIAAVSGRPVGYKDIDQEAWISGAVAAGVPAD